MNRRRFLASTCLSIAMVAAPPMFANASDQPERIEAPDALAAVNAGKMILVDVRRPSEWQKTGIASVAIPLSMHEKGFLEGLQNLKAKHPDKRIAMICAVGGRTGYLQRELKRRKIADIIDVSEGMIGNRKHPGWIKRGLPITPWSPPN